MEQRPLLSQEQRSEAVSAAVSAYHRDVVDAVSEAVQQERVVVVGMAQNPHVKSVRKALEEAAVEFTYLEYGSYLSMWKQRLAIKLWSGWPTFPQVFVDGKLIGGASATRHALAEGTLTGGK